MSKTFKAICLALSLLVLTPTVSEAKILRTLLGFGVAGFVMKKTRGAIVRHAERKFLATTMGKTVRRADVPDRLATAPNGMRGSAGRHGVEGSEMKQAPFQPTRNATT